MCRLRLRMRSHPASNGSNGQTCNNVTQANGVQRRLAIRVGCLQTHLPIGVPLRAAPFEGFVPVPYRKNMTPPHSRSYSYGCQKSTYNILPVAFGVIVPPRPSLSQALGAEPSLLRLADDPLKTGKPGCDRLPRYRRVISQPPVLSGIALVRYPAHVAGNKADCGRSWLRHLRIAMTPICDLSGGPDASCSCDVSFHLISYYRICVIARHQFIRWRASGNHKVRCGQIDKLLGLQPNRIHEPGYPDGTYRQFPGSGADPKLQFTPCPVSLQIKCLSAITPVTQAARMEP